MWRFFLFLCALFVQPAQFTYAQACDPAYVDFSSEGEVKIEPGSVEDAENIQCAVDEAIKVGKNEDLPTDGGISVGGKHFVCWFYGRIQRRE